MALSYQSPADVSSGSYDFTVSKLYGRIETVAKAFRAKAVRADRDDS